jgi:hypothetical protein
MTKTRVLAVLSRIELAMHLSLTELMSDWSKIIIIIIKNNNNNNNNRLYSAEWEDVVEL